MKELGIFIGEMRKSAVSFQIESKQDLKEISLMARIILTDQTESAKLNVVASRVTEFPLPIE